jgi:hypothetical protein
MFTVIGQKALIDSFYSFLMAERNGQFDEQLFLNITEKYIKRTNKVFTILQNCEFDFFGENNQPQYKKYMKKASNKLSSYGISTNFWDDLLYFDGNIKYNKTGLRAIVTVFEFIGNCIDALENNCIDKVLSIKIDSYKNKTKARLIADHDKSEVQAENLSIEFVNLKSDFIKDQLRSINISNYL